MQQKKIIIIDDDNIFASSLKDFLDEYDVDFFSSSKDGIDAIENGSYSILILDYLIDQLTGLDVVNKIRESNHELYIILLTGYSQDMPAMEALRKMDIQDYCVKKHNAFEDIQIRVEAAFRSVEQIEKIKNVENKDTFGVRLKFLRSVNCETQLDLASKIKVSRQTVASYETDRNEPNFEILRRICEHYKVSADYLIGIKFVK